MQTSRRAVLFKRLMPAVATTAVFALLYLLTKTSYLFFHSFVEIFAIVVAWSIFVLMFNTRRFIKTGYFIFLGTGFLFVGLFNLFHALAYKGMDIIPGSENGNMATQLWIAMHYLQCFTFLCAPLFIYRKIRIGPLFSGFLIVSAGLLLSILKYPVFPDCFIPGSGLTPFKKISEYVICALLLTSLGLLYRKRAAFHRDVFRLLSLSIILTVGSELSFTLYMDPTGWFNVMGHGLEVLAFLAAYKGFVEKGLVEPYDLIFRDLKQQETELRNSEERYHSLFDSMTEGFALHEIICDSRGVPCDYRFLAVNPAFEKMTGLSREKVLNRTYNEVLPDEHPHWVRKYGTVALTGNPIRFEQYSSALQRYYDVFAYCPAPKQFAVIFMDITELKTLRTEIEDLASFPLLSSNPIVDADMDGKICFANPAARRIFPDIAALGKNHPWFSDWNMLVDSCRDKTDNAILPDREVIINDRCFHLSRNFVSASRHIRIYGIDITEKKHLQDRHEKAQAEIVAARTAADTIHSMTEGVLLMDLDGRVLSINPAMEKITGYPESEINEKSVLETLPALFRDKELTKARNAIQKLQQGQETELSACTLHTPDGRTVSAIPTASFIRRPNGTALSIVLTLRDISRLKETESELKTAKERLEKIFDNTHVCIVYLDADFNFIQVNRTYADACGRPVEFFLGKNHFDLYPHKENEQIFRNVITTGKAFSVQAKPFEFPDHPEWGTTYWDWSLQPVKNEKGDVEGLVFCLQDVTARRRAETSLNESEEKYRELVENANNVIMRVTPDQTITFFNEYAQHFFGYSADEIIGRNVFGTIAAENDPKTEGIRDMLLQIGSSPEHYASNENWNVCKDGRRAWINWTNKAIRDKNGNITEILCVGTDATARKKVQDENLRYQERLCRLAEQLVVSEEQNRLQISRYIHDAVIQNLSLSSIKLGSVQDAATQNGFAQGIKEIKTTRELIDEAIVQCRAIMSDLTPPLLHELGIVPALAEFSEQVQTRHGISIEIRHEGELNQADNSLRSLLFQSIRELVMNALKHAGCSTLCISLTRTENGVQASVRDDGCGIKAGTDDEKNVTSGGFGLFGIRERIENLGGQMEIRSKPEKGTEVMIFVPLSPR